MEESIYLKVTSEHDGLRLDQYLSAVLDNVSRSAAQKLIEDGCVQCMSNKKMQKRSSVRTGEEYEVAIPAPTDYTAIPQEMDLNIVYEDKHLIVINKDKGIVVHPAPGNTDGTLVNGILHHCKGQLSGINGVIRPGIVHRIDKDTSGLLVIAKDDATHIGLSEQLAAHSMDRIYEAVVYGRVKEYEGKVDLPIGRHQTDRKKMAVVSGGRRAVTHYKVINHYEGFTRLSLQLETGRTHQIRVHMAAMGHPLAGDSIYGPAKVISALEGQCLHAKTLGFVHPITKEKLSFDSELPEYFNAFLSKLKPC